MWNCYKLVCECVCVIKLEPYTEPWQDLVFGPVTCDVANVEGDPVSIVHHCFIVV